MERAGLARRLAEVSEGWAAGINLLFSSLAGKGPEEMRVFWNDVAFHGGGTFDFLAEEVFAQQSPRVKEFLVRTAILEVVSPESGDWLMDRYGETLGPPVPGGG
ncbi:MAG: hypothetical protein M1299_00815, partial [Firmicutes bacterium]|nr:hypothetical protein [Bacillota bacterium]